MGVMRFVVSPPQRITEEVVQQAYLSGIDRIVWRAQAGREGDELVLRRAVSESGNLHVPWQVEGHGRLTLSTASLMEQPRPYHLPLELARGTIGQLREQLAEWQSFGLGVSPQVSETLSRAVEHFGRAAVSHEAHPQVSAGWAERAIRLALDAADLLAAAYIDQATAVRRSSEGSPPAFLGAGLGSSPLDDYAARQFLLSFNAAAVPVCWREIEASEGSCRWAITDEQLQWCKTHGLTVCGGPLLKLSPQGLPDWLYLWENDFRNLMSFISEFIQSAVLRYQGKVDLWQCAARLNSADILSLSEEDKLRLAVCAIESTRAVDPHTPAVVSFDQPWAEYMSHRELDFPPLHFADALVRAGLDLSGLMLEINLGCCPGGTLPRTPLELSRQLDCWSILGLPLYVSISIPSAAHTDRLARRRARLASGNWTANTQRAWVSRYIPLILSKPYVQGIVWNQLRDAEPHEFPHGGLFDAQGHAKPALNALASIRQAYLL